MTLAGPQTFDTCRTRAQGIAMSGALVGREDFVEVPCENRGFCQSKQLVVPLDVAHTNVRLHGVPPMQSHTAAFVHEVVEFLDGQPRDPSVDHAVAVGTQERKVSEHGSMSRAGFSGGSELTRRR
jgi:hypothetical protein